MKVMKWSAIALAVTAASTQLVFAAPFVSDQATAKGFIEDSTATVLLRSIYWNQDNKGYHNRDNKDWTTAALGNFSSGYTTGTIGVGFDAFAYGAYAINSKGGGTGNISADADGDHDTGGKAGGAVKFRISKTELKIGDMSPSTSPVFAVGGSRIMPQTASGVSLQSSELKGLDVELGHYTSSTSSASTNRDGGLYATYAGVQTDAVNFGGGRYAVNDQLTVGAYMSQFHDIWNQYYGNVNYVLPITGDQSMTFDFNYYNTQDSGQAKAGDINNNTFSLAAAYSFLTAHTVTLGFQKVNGSTPFDYIGVGDNKGGGGGDSIFLANSIQVSDFNSPGERSFKLQYDLAMATYGVPGLSFMARYVYGDNIHAATLGSVYNSDGTSGFNSSGATHNETNVEAKYVVQEGPAKNLSFRTRLAWHNASGGQVDGDGNNFRLIVDYPITIL
ncbi:OprD family porin [Pseudomonas sp. MWU16-30317]|uniref:OprD family porin n=1 Tax=Pseudomonas sp. MWU16-30317 TaxID=2878095 RepID=UPI001CFA50DC|nr:OprD family porin [Pseudomonas sp. MWU16-30317]